ncbi:hypothetical protein [Paenibacillus methanolicus]|uniref:HEAT repeat protein n=1 Tax=Paenibacillus methanolicus TaxID=582686 RepID=A0A5S5BMK2_9BACL|nr:hypothetical protein [Paenibacillus methanolicus]TYP68381.1 hypothetical protein BCM02_11966 [Paenibacillus methanolicus]
MSIAILTELQAEVRRLFIAGSGLAASDPRLLKLQPQLAKLGESSLAFKKLDEGVRKTTEASGAAAAAALLELSGLLHAMLYTQGKSEPRGASVPIDALGSAGRTTISYRKLAPVLEALTSRGSGRLQVLRQGQKDGVFHDFRAFLPAVQGLADVPEIAEYLARKVLPSIGARIVPVLLRQFDVQGGKADARMLGVIHAIEGEKQLALYERAAREGAVELQIEAIGLLARYDGFLPLLLEHSQDGLRAIRQAAYDALALQEHEEAAKRLMEALPGRDSDMVIEPIRQSRYAPLEQRVVAYVRSELGHYADAMAGFERSKRDNPEQPPANPSPQMEQSFDRLIVGIQALKGKRSDGALQAVSELLGSEIFLAGADSEMKEYVAKLLLDMERADADEALLSRAGAAYGWLAGFHLRAAIRHWTATDVYDRFAPLLAKRSAESVSLKEALVGLVPDMREVLRHVSWHKANADEGALPAERTELPEALSDRRWMKRLAEADLPWMLLPYLLRYEADAETLDYLRTQLNAALDSRKKQDIAYTLWLGLFIAGVPLDAEQLRKLVRQLAAQYGYAYIDPASSALLRSLPASCAPALEELLSDGTVARLVSVLEPILEDMKRNQFAEFPADEGAERYAWLKSKM